MIQDIFRFLDVDDNFIPDMSTKHNQTLYLPKNKLFLDFVVTDNPLKQILRHIIPTTIRQPLAAKAFRRNIEPPEKLPEEDFNQLKNIFREDIIKLQKLINRDLSSWL
jgi:hypothetical protein